MRFPNFQRMYARFEYLKNVPVCTREGTKMECDCRRKKRPHGHLVQAVFQVNTAVDEDFFSVKLGLFLFKDTSSSEFFLLSRISIKPALRSSVYSENTEP